jgi:hypothetical protein
MVCHRAPSVLLRAVIVTLLLIVVAISSLAPGVSGQTIGPVTGTPAEPGAGSPADGTAATPLAATPETSSGTPVVGSPGRATPVPATPAVSLACSDPCLVRFASGSPIDEALTSTGMRASYRTDRAVWVGGTAADLGRLVASGPDPVFVMDAAPSLKLYAVTEPDGNGNADALAAFGTVLDTDGTTSIVDVPTVPADVKELTAAGVQVEKVAPYVPAGTPLLTTETVATLPDVSDVTETFPDLSTGSIEQTIGDLASTGVAPGEIGSRYFALPGNSVAAEYLYLRFAAYGLTVWYEDYIASNGLLSINVVAEVPGVDSSQIYAGFAHYDSISDDVPDNDTAPGALDNGSGLAILLENARILSGYRLNNPVRFVALDGEEVGLQGANAFGARHAERGTPIVGGINIDSVGTAYGQRVLYVNASETSSYIQDIMLEQYDANGFQLNVQPRQNPAIVADETPLTQNGIPTILVATMLYGDPLINCTCDTIDGVDFDFVRATGRLVLMTFAVLAAPAA